jgi:hypothetical protein
MTIMVAAAATPTYADFFLQIVPTGSGSFGGTTTGLTAPNLNVSLGIGGSAVYEVFAVKNNGNPSATITYSSPPFSIVGSDPDVTFSWTPTVASGGSFAMTNANTTSANGFKIGDITVNILGSASYGDTRTLTDPDFF